MNRVGEVVFTLLLFVPLAGTAAFGPDSLRLPITLGLVTLLAARVAWSVARRREDNVRSDPLRTAAVLYLGACLLSLVAAANGWDGVAPVLTLLAGIGAYLFITSGCLSRAYLFRWGLPALAASGLVFAALGLGNPESTLGNTNYAGALSAMILPFAAALVYAKRHAALRIGFGLTAAALLAHVLLTRSRGGFLGAGAGILVAGLVVTWHSKRRWAVPALAAGLLLVAGGAFAWRGRDWLSRGETVRVRLGLWRGTANLALAKPVIGAGIGNFSAQFPPYREAEEYALAHPGGGSDWGEAENAHSTWLQIAAETGALGLLGWLLVVYVAARLWRYYLTVAPDADYVAALAGAGGGIAAFLVSGFFNTLHVFASFTVLFWIYLGLIEQLGNQRVRVHKRPLGDLRIALQAAAAVAGAFGTYVAIELAVGDALYLQAVKKGERERVALLEESLAHNYRDWRPHYELGVRHNASGRFKDAEARFREVLQRRPHHVGAINNLAQAVSRGDGKPEAALELLDRAIRIAPYYYLSHFNRGVVLAMSKDYAGAREAYARALERRPGHAVAHYNVGETWYMEGRHDRALEEFRRARLLGFDVGARLRAEHPEAERETLYREFFR